MPSLFACTGLGAIITWYTQCRIAWQNICMYCVLTRNTHSECSIDAVAREIFQRLACWQRRKSTEIRSPLRQPHSVWIVDTCRIIGCVLAVGGRQQMR